MTSFKPRAGDIGMYMADGRNWFKDKAIQLVSMQTHCSYFISKDQMIEANTKGVVQSTYTPDLKHIHVYRMPHGYVSNEVLDYSLNLAKYHLGDRYDIPQGILAAISEAYGWPLKGRFIDDNWNCSEYIAYILQYGLLKLHVSKERELRAYLPKHITEFLIKEGWQRII